MPKTTPSPVAAKSIKQPSAGSKAAQVRALREGNTAPSPEKARAAVKSKTTAKASRKAAGARKKQMPRKPAVKPKAAAAPAAAPAQAGSAPREGSKLETVGKLLSRKQGCTTAEVLKATGWPTVSMPQQAEALGMTLRSEPEGRGKRYYGTPNAA